jgi:hypothetical protein
MSIQYPIAGELNKQFRITSPFGPRVHPITGVRRNHNGTDFIMVPARAGAPILAPEAGLVLESRKSTAAGGGYGYYIKIQGQETGAVHILAHMVAGSLRVKKGDIVRMGQHVGNMGTTGASTGVHLHWETIVRGTPIDPLIWHKNNQKPPKPELVPPGPMRAWTQNRNDGTVQAHIVNAPVGSKVRVRHNGASVFNKTINSPDDFRLTKTVNLIRGRNRITIEVDGVEIRGATYNYQPLINFRKGNMR